MYIKLLAHDVTLAIWLEVHADLEFCGDSRLSFHGY